MKRKRIVASNKPVTTVVVQGNPHHYCHSKALGKIRVILIDPDENIPVPFVLTQKAKDLVEKSHVELIHEEIELFEQEQAVKELSKGDKLALLINCGNRLHDRFQLAREALDFLPENDYEGRKKAFAYMKRVNDASDRIVNKISELINGKMALLLPSPTLCVPKLKNSQLKKLHEHWQGKWQSFWDSDLDLMDEDYSEIANMLSHINDEIERRERMGNWS